MPHAPAAGLEFLNGVGKGVETHAAELEEPVGGDIHSLLESRDSRPPPSFTGSVEAATSSPADSSSMGSMAAAPCASSYAMRPEPGSRATIMMHSSTHAPL
jgi:hypothetical protein